MSCPYCGSETSACCDKSIHVAEIVNLRAEVAKLEKERDNLQSIISDLENDGLTVAYMAGYRAGEAASARRVRGDSERRIPWV